MPLKVVNSVDNFGAFSICRNKSSVRLYLETGIRLAPSI